MATHARLVIYLASIISFPPHFLENVFISEEIVFNYFKLPNSRSAADFGFCWSLTDSNSFVLEGEEEYRAGAVGNVAVCVALDELSEDKQL